MTNNTLKNVSYALLCLLLSFKSFGQQTNPHHQIDLRSNNWGQGESYSLKGDWLFAWKKFIDINEDPSTSWSNVHVPGSWQQDSSELHSEEIQRLGKGYGTYYKKILVPKGIDKFYLYLPDMASAYELWGKRQ